MRSASGWSWGTLLLRIAVATTLLVGDVDVEARVGVLGIAGPVDHLVLGVSTSLKFREMHSRWLIAILQLVQVRLNMSWSWSFLQGLLGFNLSWCLPVDVLSALFRFLLRMVELTCNWLRMNFLWCPLSQDVLELVLAVILFFASVIDCDANLVLILKLTVMDFASHFVHVWLRHGHVRTSRIVIPGSRLSRRWHAFLMDIVGWVLRLMRNKSEVCCRLTLACHGRHGDLKLLLLKRHGVLHLHDHIHELLLSFLCLLRLAALRVDGDCLFWRFYSITLADWGQVFGVAWSFLLWIARVLSFTSACVSRYWLILLFRSCIVLQKCKLRVVVSSSFGVVDVLNFDDCALTAVSHVDWHLSEREDVLAEVALGEWVAALNGFVADLILFIDAQATPFTHDAHEVTVIQLVCSQ